VRKSHVNSSRSGGSSSRGTSGLSASELEAVVSAKEYLQESAFSKQGLIDQLDSSAGSGFSANDATAAVDSLHVDWNAEAAKAAKQYLQTTSFSCQGLIQQLSSSAGSQFTAAQAQYGASKAGICS
jgi:short-subunit dehydrogenase